MRCMVVHNPWLYVFKADSLIHVIKELECTSRIRRRRAETNTLGSDVVSTIFVSRTPIKYTLELETLGSD